MRSQPSPGRKSQPPRIVAIGGGTGLPNLLTGLAHHQRRGTDLHISAIVTTFDDGGSTGMLRKQYGIPALGDIRRCLTALAYPSDQSDSLREIMNHRFDAQSGIPGHNLGNLILAALLRNHGDLNTVIKLAAKVLNIQGEVIPVSTEPADLRAELGDGTWIESETAIDTRAAVESPIERIALNRPVPANPDAIAAIDSADIITLGPGDLYTSVIPNLLPEGMATALRNASARVIYICNLRNKPAETARFTASDFIRTVNSYIGDHRINAVLMNDATDTHGPDPSAVQQDAELALLVSNVVTADLADATCHTQHSPDLLAEQVIKLLHQIR